MATRKKTIGILTGGGDCPGLNAVIRSVAKTAMNDYGMRVIGIKDGYFGLVKNKSRLLEQDDVSNILAKGGTILGTSNRDDPFRFAVKRRPKPVYRDRSSLFRSGATCGCMTNPVLSYV